MRLIGKVQNRVALRAADGRLHKMPDDASERAALMRLRKRGLLQVTRDFSHYYVPPDTKLSPKQDLLDRLKEGPLRSEEWQSVAASRKSLHVRIKKLRNAGYDIEAVRDGEYSHYGPVTYVLNKKSAAH